MANHKETWNAADVRCPFFMGERAGKRDIVCEGFTEKMKLSMQFTTLRAKDSYMGRHCVGPYERCPVYQMTMKKYEIE